MFSFRLLNKIINFQKIVRLCVNEVVLFCQMSWSYWCLFNININNTPVVQNVLLGSPDLSSSFFSVNKGEETAATAGEDERELFPVTFTL